MRNGEVPMVVREAFIIFPFIAPHLQKNGLLNNCSVENDVYDVFRSRTKPTCPNKRRDIGNKELHESWIKLRS